MILTQQERKKFALYCQQTSKEARDFIKQMEGISVDGGVMTKIFKQRLAAFALVANYLETGEESNVG